jgi:hypothetical protein
MSINMKCEYIVKQIKETYKNIYHTGRSRLITYSTHPEVNKYLVFGVKKT